MKLSITPPAGFADPRTLAGLSPDAPIAVALSGGADSVALLAMLCTDPHVSAIHVHHGIRGAEADRDEAFCVALSEKLGVPLTVLHIDAPALARERRVGLETAARDGRYAAMTAHLKEQNIPLLVTAHHADDQLETLLHNLLRGAGLSGLCGIPACRSLDDGIFVARPLLALTRETLLTFVRACGLDFMTDSTNAEPCCTRNRLRLEVLPALKQIAPHAATNAARCAATLQEDNAYLESLADAFLRERDGALCVTDLAALERPVFARVMRAWLPIVPERVHIDALFTLCQTAKPHAALSLPGVTVRVIDRKLTQQSIAQGKVTDYLLPLTEGENEIAAIGGLAVLTHTLIKEEISPKQGFRYAARLRFVAAAVQGELYLRPRRVGDKILSGGMHKTVRRLAGLTHLPPTVRAYMPLVCDEAGLFAVPFAAYRDGACKQPDATLDLYFN